MFGLVKQQTLDAANSKIAEAESEITRLENEVATGVRRLKDEELAHQATRNGWRAEKELIEQQVLERIANWNNAVEQAKVELSVAKKAAMQQLEAKRQAEESLDRMTALYETGQQEIAALKAERERLETTIRRNAQAHEQALTKLTEENNDLKLRAKLA